MNKTLLNEQVALQLEQMEKRIAEMSNTDTTALMQENAELKAKLATAKQTMSSTAEHMEVRTQNNDTLKTMVNDGEEYKKRTQEFIRTDIKALGATFQKVYAIAPADVQEEMRNVWTQLQNTMKTLL